MTPPGPCSPWPTRPASGWPIARAGAEGPAAPGRSVYSAARDDRSPLTARLKPLGVALLVVAGAQVVAGALAPLVARGEGPTSTAFPDAIFVAVALANAAAAAPLLWGGRGD